MGARHSKRSVDISGSGKETDEVQPLDGKLEKLDEGPKMVVNGASHSEVKVDQHDEQVSNGDPISLPEQAVIAEEARPSSPDELQPETSSASEVIQPPKKKEKVKKKWSLRSLSFSKKDKLKPGKEDAKEDAEGVAEVSEEKAEEGSVSILSSVTETLTKANEAVTDAVVAAEHKVEEGLTATQDQVEKISAKVAEKAEALVDKMEAMTVQAVDAAKEMIGVGLTTAGDVDTSEIAVPEVTSNQLPEVEVITAALSEAPKIVSEIAEVPESNLVKPCATNITVPEPITLDPVVSESVTTVVVSQEESASNVFALKTGLTGLISEISMAVVNESDIPAITEAEVSVQESTVTKTVEVPPPLPASPPPSTGVAITEVINMAAQLGETKDVQNVDNESSTSSTIVLPTSAQVPATLPEAVPSEDIGAAGEPHQPCSTSVVTEVLTQVLETAERSFTTDLSNQQEEQNEEQMDAGNEQPTPEESSNSASGTSGVTEDHNTPPPNQSAEE